MEQGFDGVLKKSFHVIDKSCKNTEDPERATDLVSRSFQNFKEKWIVEHMPEDGGRVF